MQTGNFKVFLNALLVINPTNDVLLIGAGNGHGELVEWLIQNKVNAVTLVEPQDAAFKQLEAHISNSVSDENQNWTLHKEVVAEQPGLVDFYYTSKSTENGLISPELLNHIWPNLALVQQETLSATSLGAFYLNSAQELNWLIIDCLGALKVIGQAQHLANVDVAIVKVLFNAEDAINTYSDYTAITAIFNKHGFSEKFRHTGLHPDIGYVVFVRDYKSQSKALLQQLVGLKTTYELAQSKHASEQEAWLSANQASKVESQQQAEVIAQQQSQIQQLQQQLSELKTSYEQAQTKHTSEQEGWLSANQASKAEAQQQAGVIAQQQSQIQQLQQQLSGLKTTCEKNVSQLKELELQNQNSKAREDKLAARYELMCKEIERAEAQLNFIKEMGL